MLRPACLFTSFLDNIGINILFIVEIEAVTDRLKSHFAKPGQRAYILRLDFTPARYAEHPGSHERRVPAVQVDDLLFFTLGHVCSPSVMISGLCRVLTLYTMTMNITMVKNIAP